MLRMIIIFAILLPLYSDKIILTKAEREFIDSHYIKCETTTTWQPFNTTKDGKLSGIAIDYWNIIKKQLHIKSYCTPVNSWSQVLYDIKNKKADISLCTADTPDKRKYAVFTKPYVKYPIVIATKNNVGFISDITLLKDKKIAVGKNYTSAQILKENYPNFHIIEAENIDEALKLLCQDKVYAVIDILPVIAYKINRYEFSSLKISGKTPWNFNVKFMIRNDYGLLVSSINKAIDNITEDEKVRIYSKWIKIKQKGLYSTNDVFIILFAFAIIVFLILFYVGYLRKEIRKRKVLESQLERLATFDKLTNIFNRYKMDLALEEQIEIAKRYNRDLSIIFFDIDHFKLINDDYGHKVGDIVLKELTKLVEKSIRKSDIFGRWGGEEFLIILPETTKEEAILLAEKLRKNIENHKFKKIKILTCSFGVTDYKKDDTFETIITRVDKKLYVAKKSGRNRVKYE